MDTYCIDFDYVRELLKHEISNNFQSQILKGIVATKLDTAIFLMGFEGDNAKISEIIDSEVVDYTKINFHTIGSGSIQAQNTSCFKNNLKKMI